MITLKELLGKYTVADIPHSDQLHLEELLKRINMIRSAYGKPMTVTSCYRSQQDHLRIYRAKGVPDNKIPMGSAHLSGCAVDISDPNKELQAWCLANVSELEKAELWCEDFSATSNWVHFQIYPPRSGKRFFLP